VSLHPGQSRTPAGSPDPGNSGPEDGVRRFPPRGDDGRKNAPRRLVASLDRIEWATLLVLTGSAFIVLAALLTKGRPLSGADGLLAADQLQYFAWIRDASHHLLIGNRFDLAPGDRAFLHPGFAISGGLHALGVSVPLSYLLWKPVAIGVTFCGSLLYVRRLIPTPGARHAALILALFAVMPASWLVAWSDWGGNARQYTFDFISGEMWSGQYLWGYLMTAIAVFLMPLVLLAHERGRTGWAAAGALLVCWLQPWQGATLALIILGVAGWRRLRDAPSPFGLRDVIVLGAVAAPAFYYLLLGRFDPAWELASKSNAAGAMPEWGWPWWAVAVTLAPLALPAALAYRLPAASWQEQAVRVWPFAALLVYLLPVGTFPYHSFQGLALPLAILAVQGLLTVWRHPRPLVVAGLLFLMTVPGIAHKLEVSLHSVRSAGDPFWIFDDEVRALRAIERDPRPGGVLGSVYAGYMLPYTTGRETWIGALSWTPDWRGRQRKADGLIVDGTLHGQAARDFVTSTRARFVFVDCRPGLRDLEPELRPILEATRRFGCASVYVVKDHPAMARAAGRPDE
jgi:hypothetical protein